MVGRWLAPDPMRQYVSPYIAFGNNPVNRVDPDGGVDGPIMVEGGPCQCSTVDANGNRVTFNAQNLGATDINFTDYVASSGGMQYAGITIGDDFFSTTGSLLGLKGLIVEQLSADWDAASNKQQWKKSHEIHKALKARGINFKTSYIKSGIPGALNNFGRGLGAASGLVTVGDVLYNSELKPSHILDATVTGLSFIPGAGWVMGGGYLILDIGSRTLTDQGIGDHVDSYFGGPIYDWDW